MHLPSLGSMPPPQADAPLHSNLPGATDALAALKAASKACHAAPNRPEAHYVYGQAWLALGNHVNAERAFAAALQLAPRWPEAWVNYGIVRYRQGHIEDAKTAMRQALLSAPGHPAATANLGAFMRITGEAEAARRCCALSSPARPRTPGPGVGSSACPATKAADCTRKKMRRRQRRHIRPGGRFVDYRRHGLGRRRYRHRGRERAARPKHSSIVKRAA